MKRPGASIRVLHVMGTARPGGVETFVTNLAYELSGSNIELTVAILGSEGPVADELRDIGVRVIALNLGRDASRLARVKAYASLPPFDLLHANTGGLLLRTVARARGCRAIFAHVHGPPDHWMTDGWPRDPWAVERAFAWGTQQFLCCSQATWDLLWRGRRRPKQPISIVPHGIAVGPRTPRSDDVRSTRVVGFVGRLTAQKGVMHLLHAARIVLARRPETRFVIVGDGTERQRLEDEAKGIHPAAFTFVGERSDARQLMADFDLLAVPSEWEPFGIVNLEAMAAELPVVAFAVDGIPEVVEDQVTGLLVRPRDPAVLADAILALLADPIRCRQMGAAGRRRVEEHFSRARMARTIVQLYDKALGRESHE
jgi:glycosyltransferase involved in cell wall biosynthesis